MSSTPSICAALVTPVDDTGNVCSQRFIAHAHWVLQNGCDTIVVFGTTGEAPSFSPIARVSALEALVSNGIQAEKLIVGTGCCSVEDTQSLTRHAIELGCHGVLIHPPFFFKAPTDDGIFTFFNRVIGGLSQSQANIYLYHFPEMTGAPITIPLIARLLESFPSYIAGIKDSTGDFDNMKALVEQFPMLKVFSGDDHLLWPLLEVGGAGAITATANLAPNLLADVLQGWQANTDTAQTAHITLQKLWEGMLLNFPISEAIKEIITEVSGDPDWRPVCPPLLQLPPSTRAQLLHEVEPFIRHFPPGLGVANNDVATS